MNLSPAIKQLYYEQVWALVQQIPYGRVVTYGQITKMLPHLAGISTEDYKLFAPRWVGLAMGACPDNVPWQRVVNSKGKISSRPEAARHKMLLEKEGVLFLNDKLEMDQYQWHGPGQDDRPKQECLF